MKSTKAKISLRVKNRKCRKRLIRQNHELFSWLKLRKHTETENKIK